MLFIQTLQEYVQRRRRDAEKHEADPLKQIVATCQANVAKLKELGITVQAAYNGNGDQAVKILLETMLNHNKLPTLYKASLHA